jgi:hypothetical protein
MTIITYRPSKPAQAAETKVPRPFRHTPKCRAWRVPSGKIVATPLEPDPEADARVEAFLARMLRPKDGDSLRASPGGYGMGLKTTIMVLLAAAVAALVVFHLVTQDVTREEYKRHLTIEQGTRAKH